MGHAGTSWVFVIVVCLRLVAAGLLTDDDEKQDKYEDAGDKDHDADHLLQADVPGGGDELVTDLGMEFANLSAETQRAVTLIRAVRVVALASVGAGVLHALVHITQTPGQNIRTP